MTDHTEMQIPRDILEAATECYRGLLTTCERWDDEDAADDIPAIAMLILRERERCARIAESHLNGRVISAKIRSVDK